jgi:predicted RNA binding protein YcfA (HicA-like mRNA interferase family)
MSDYRRTLEEILKKNGWELERFNCTHAVLRNPENPNKVTLPNRVGDRNLARRVLRQAGIRGVHPL